MKLQSLVLATATATFAFATVAHAGTVGAGPAGTGSTLVGSAVTTDAIADAVLHTPAPGVTGAVALAPDQLVAVEAYLKSLPEAKVDGDVVTCPTRFADDSDGLITLDTKKGTLTLTRT